MRHCSEGKGLGRPEREGHWRLLSGWCGHLNEVEIARRLLPRARALRPAACQKLGDRKCEDGNRRAARESECCHEVERDSRCPMGPSQAFPGRRCCTRDRGGGFSIGSTMRASLGFNHRRSASPAQHGART